MGTDRPEPQPDAPTEVSPSRFHEPKRAGLDPADAVDLDKPEEEPNAELRAQMLEEFTKILSAINTANNQLRKFEQNHPGLVAPNILRVWEDGLKETSTVMFREYYRMRNEQ